MRCSSEVFNGYAYKLSKEIVLQEDEFTINYLLANKGERDIMTNLQDKK